MEEEEEEIYSIVRDGYESENPNKEEQGDISRYMYPDLNGVVLSERRQEQINVIGSPNIDNRCSDELDCNAYRMICVTERYAFASRQDPIYPEKEKDRMDERFAYEQKIRRIESFIQAEDLIEEISARSRLFGLGDDLKWVRDRAIEERNKYKPTVEELARTQAAQERANTLAAKIDPRLSEDRPQIDYFLCELVGGRFVYSETKKKKKKAHPQPGCGYTLYVVDLKPDFPKWVSSRIKIAHGGKICQKDDLLIIVEHINDEVKVRIYNLPPMMVKLKVKNYKPVAPIKKYTLFDRSLKLNTLLDVKFVNVNEILVLFSGHVWCITNNASYVLVSKTQSSEEKKKISTPKPVFRSISYTTPTRFVVGSIDGTMYWFNVTDGTCVFMLDFPLKIPLIGIVEQGPMILCFSEFSVFRIHSDMTSVPSYQLDINKAMGITGCGSLIMTCSEKGSIWIADTFDSQKRKREIFPLPQLSTERKITQEHTFRHLHVPFTYRYDSVWMGRKHANVLYPCGVVRKMEFKK
jgi:hypothetical protein